MGPTNLGKLQSGLNTTALIMEKPKRPYKPRSKRGGGRQKMEEKDKAIARTVKLNDADFAALKEKFGGLTKAVKSLLPANLKILTTEQLKDNRGNAYEYLVK